MKKKTFCISSCIFVFLLIGTLCNAQVSYQNYFLGEAMSNVIDKLEKSGIKYEKQDNFEYDEVGILNGKLVSVGSIFSGNREYFKDNYNKNTRFTAKVTSTVIRFDDDNGHVVLHFDYKGKLMEIFVVGITTDFDVLKQALIKKYGPPSDSWRNQVGVGIEFEISKYNAHIIFSQYVDGSGRGIAYENTTLKYAHKLKQYNDQKAINDKELDSKSGRVKGF